VKFQVFKDGKTLDDFEPRGAYLFGADGIPIRRAQIDFKNGLLHYSKPNLETAGLALLWPIDGFGKVMLPTTCLPERPDPYNLNLEIARAKLMQIIIKREDWSFVDDVEGLSQNLGQAQDLFIKAVQNITDAPKAAELADQSLKKAIVFSEALAAKHAQNLFGARGKGHGFGRGCLGCRIEPDQIANPKYLNALLKLFGFMMVPVNWALIENQQGAYDFSKLDACITTLSKRKVIIGAGPLLCFSKQYLPTWLLDTAPSFEKIRENAYRFVSAIAARYSGIVRAWCAISGLNAFNHFGFGFEQILEITRAATMAVKASAERALKIIEVANPWGEYYASSPDTIPPLVYMDMVVQSGINFDAFALEMKFGKDQPGMHVRDMMHVSAMLDYFAPFAKPIYVTNVEVPSKNGAGPYDPQLAGMWHNHWDQNRQAEWMQQFYRIALSKPVVDAVVYGNLADAQTADIPDSGLITAQGQPKKSYQLLKKFHEGIFRR